MDSAVERINSVHNGHRPERYDKLMHFIFTFHDSMFECVARDLKKKAPSGVEPL